MPPPSKRQSAKSVKSAEIVIRKAEERDLRRILELYQQLALSDEPARPDQWRKYLPVFRQLQQDPRQQLIVCEAGGKVVGTLVFIILPNLSHGGAPYAEVENVVTDASVRRKGYGRLLMEWAERTAREAGCYKLQFQSHYGRKDTAHGFYEKLGYGSPARGFRKYLRGGE